MSMVESPTGEQETLTRKPQARSGRVVSKDGTTIAFDRVGRGPPVILVVGALCSRSLGPGVKLAPELAKRFTVFTYDRRGRGETIPHAARSDARRQREGAGAGADGVLRRPQPLGASRSPMTRPP
jgi:pimeloyl-ACP methyl ester carboxylesterase